MTVTCEAACVQAIEYARAHPTDILAYIGDIEGTSENHYHGRQSHTYQPEDVCLFK